MFLKKGISVTYKRSLISDYGRNFISRVVRSYMISFRLSG